MRKATMTDNQRSNSQTANARYVQESLWGDSILEEDSKYLSRQLITYIGNKRSILNAIGEGIKKVKHRLNKDRLRILDAFSGSGVVSRYFKCHAEYLASNDIEDYAVVIARCYLHNRSDIDLRTLIDIVADLNERLDTQEFPKGFIEEMYAPRCEDKITKNDRVFYTRRNARRLDNYRRITNRVLVSIGRWK